MVEQQHLHLTTVIRINNTSTGINKMLRGETTAGSDTTVYHAKKKTVSRSLPRQIKLPAGHYLRASIQFNHVQVPSGTAMAMPVSTIALPLAGITVSFALYRSYPAAKAEPRVGARADSTSFLTSKGGRCCWMEVTAGALEAVIVSAIDSVLVRLARGEAGREGGWWVVFVEVSAGGGVVSLVMAGWSENRGKKWETQVQIN